MASNLHKMPANFNLKPRSHPFKVFVRKKSSTSFECSIEKNSIVYDFYNDKEIKINGIEDTYPIQAGSKIILSLDYEQKGAIIKSATIKVTSNDPSEPSYAPCFPEDEYYDPQSILCVTNTESVIATIDEETGSETYKLKAFQLIYHHVTKFACYSAPTTI